MKNWMWSVLVAILAVAAIELLHVPLWIMLVVVFPVLMLLLVIASVMYNFRPSLKMAEVPQYGYAPRVKALNKETEELEKLGFEKVDEFYFKTIPDSVNFILKHPVEPLYYCLYNFGQRSTFEIVTRFRDGYYLTTSATVDAGLVPRNDKALLQIFTKLPYQQFLEQHNEAVRYIESNGIKTYDIPRSEFRHEFMQTFWQQVSFVKKLPFWPVSLILRTLSKPGKAYCNPIETQYPDGIPRY